MNERPDLHRHETRVRNEAARHEDRAQANADALRRLLILINSGGIVITLLIAKFFLGKESDWITLLLIPVLIFLIGLMCTAVSLILSKLRELERANAVFSMGDDPKFPLWKHSLPWEIASLSFFIIGVLLAAGLIIWKI